MRARAPTAAPVPDMRRVPAPPVAPLIPVKPAPGNPTPRTRTGYYATGEQGSAPSHKGK